MEYINKTYMEWQEAKPTTAIIPIGSFEQHGPHLPVNTDNYQIEAVADKVAETLGAFLLPVQPITTCYEHDGKRGSLHFTPDMFFNILVSLAEGLYRQGYKKIVVLVGHGGIFITRSAVRHLNTTYRDLQVAAIDYYAQVEESEMEHSGESETSRMLYHHKELVNMDKAVDYVPDAPRSFLTYGSIFTHSPTGVWGNAKQGTVEMGKLLFDETVKGMVQTIQKAFEK